MTECSSDDAVRSRVTLVTIGVGEFDGRRHSADPADLTTLVLAAGADDRGGGDREAADPQDVAATEQRRAAIGRRRGVEQPGVDALRGLRVVVGGCPE